MKDNDLGGVWVEYAGLITVSDVSLRANKAHTGWKNLPGRQRAGTAS